MFEYVLCRKPYVRDASGRVLLQSVAAGIPDLALQGTPFPCGQCLPCRINRRRVWTHRLMLERYCHEAACFVTLTYSPETLPVAVKETGTLVKRDAQLWLKRLRKALGDKKIRYYLAGEYGELSHRPHYHAILYGIGPEYAPLIESTWSKGIVHVGECTPESCQYVAGYVTKKLTKKDDAEEKEFATMSLRPGIGYPALDKVMELMERPDFAEYILKLGDVPAALRHGARLLPFGRYLKDKLRKLMETGDSLDTFYRQIRDEWLKYKDTTFEDFSRYLTAKDDQKYRQIKWREKAFRKRSAV